MQHVKWVQLEMTHAEGWRVIIIYLLYDFGADTFGIHISSSNSKNLYILTVIAPHGYLIEWFLIFTCDMSWNLCRYILCVMHRDL